MQSFIVTKDLVFGVLVLLKSCAVNKIILKLKELQKKFFTNKSFWWKLLFLFARYRLLKSFNICYFCRIVHFLAPGLCGDNVMCHAALGDELEGACAWMEWPETKAALDRLDKVASAQSMWAVAWFEVEKWRLHSCWL